MSVSILVFVWGACVGACAMSMFECVRSIKRFKAFEKEQLAIVEEIRQNCRKTVTNISKADLVVIDQKNAEIIELKNENLRLVRALSQLDSSEFLEVGADFTTADLLFGGEENE